MFLSKEAMTIAAILQAHATDIRDDIADAIELSVVGRAEVPFLTELADYLPAVLQQSLTRAGVAANVRVRKVHQSPQVDYKNAVGKDVRCELADLLMVVKYFVPSGIEAKSIFHQVKSADGKGNSCKIDEVQLELLHQWPPLKFGRAAHGGPQPYHVMPWMPEFGSYMLMRRAPAKGGVISAVRPAYGVSPTAWRVEDSGPARVDLTTLPYTLMVQSALLNQIVFESGEPHHHGNVDQLINAVYRYIGWQPDPPEEFYGYLKDCQQKKDCVFVVIEVRVALDGTPAAQKIGRYEPLNDSDKLAQIEQKRKERDSKRADANSSYGGGKIYD